MARSPTPATTFPRIRSNREIGLVLLTCWTPEVDGGCNRCGGTMSGKIGVMGRLTAKPGREEELAALCGELSELALAHEPGMVQHAIFRDANDPKVFHIFEVFRDQAA